LTYVVTVKFRVQCNNESEFFTYLVVPYIGVVLYFFLLDAYACIFVYKNNDDLNHCNKTFPRHTSLGSAYKLSHDDKVISLFFSVLRPRAGRF
jgi:hypothetical protein